MIQFLLLLSRHGKTRMCKYYSPFPEKDRKNIQKEVSHTPPFNSFAFLQIGTMIIGRSSKLTHFLEWRQYKIVFKRYASLYFAACIEQDDNELIVLDIIHHFVEVLDRYFGNVCELDLIFNFHQSYFILEEMIVGGHIMETSKTKALKMISANDSLMDAAFFKDESTGGKGSGTNADKR